MTNTVLLPLARRREPLRSGATRTLAIALGVILAFTACTAETTIVADGETATSQPDDTTPGDAPEPTATQEPTATAVPEPTPEPEPTSEPEPTATTAPEPEPTAEATAEPSASTTDAGDPELEEFISTLDSDFSDEAAACIYQGVTENPVLLDAMLADAEIESLALEDAADVIQLTIRCAPEESRALVGDFASAGEFGEGFDGEFTECLLDELIDDDTGRQVAIGLSALNTEVPVPLEAQEPTIQAFVTCAPPEAFAESVVSSALADDPATAEAIDEECIRVNFTSEVTYSLFEAIIIDQVEIGGDAPPEVTATLLQPILGCISLGEILRGEFAADGIDLSDATVMCVDDEMGDTALADSMAGGDDFETDFLAAMLGCMTPEELVALGG